MSKGVFLLYVFHFSNFGSPEPILCFPEAPSSPFLCCFRQKHFLFTRGCWRVFFSHETALLSVFQQKDFDDLPGAGKHKMDSGEGFPWSCSEKPENAVFEDSLLEGVFASLRGRWKAFFCKVSLHRCFSYYYGLSDCLPILISILIIYRCGPTLNRKSLFYLKSDKFTSYFRLTIPFDINYIKTGKTFGR